MIENEDRRGRRHK